jgi:hypothetical protein
VATVDVIATAIDAAASDDEDSDAHADPAAAPSSAVADSPSGPDPLAGLDAEHQRIVAEFERELGIDPERDTEDNVTNGHGARGGDPHGRTGTDTAIGGRGHREVDQSKGAAEDHVLERLDDEHPCACADARRTDRRDPGWTRRGPDGMWTRRGWTG